MNTINIIIIALGLAMDAFAVSLVTAASGYVKNSRASFRLSFHFGLFQFLMPVLGWYLGLSFVPYLISLDHWIAFGLLAFVGSRMIFSGMNLKVQSYTKDPSRGFTLIMLSIAVSIDALAIGMSLAMLKVTIWYPSVIIGVITTLLSFLAIHIGKHLGVIFGKRMEILGGVILIAIGFRILYTLYCH
jgi:putative Mn2+ efflux pump MntP